MVRARLQWSTRDLRYQIMQRGEGRTRILILDLDQGFKALWWLEIHEGRISTIDRAEYRPDCPEADASSWATNSGSAAYFPRICGARGDASPLAMAWPAFPLEAGSTQVLGDGDLVQRVYGDEAEAIVSLESVSWGGDSAVQYWEPGKPWWSKAQHFGHMNYKGERMGDGVRVWAEVVKWYRRGEVPPPESLPWAKDEREDIVEGYLYPPPAERRRDAGTPDDEPSLRDGVEVLEDAW